MDHQFEERRWHINGVCPRCTGAVRFHLSAVDDWNGLADAVLDSPDRPQAWQCPHCFTTHANEFDGWVGPVRRRRAQRRLVH